jgi:uncharacterized membrane protein YciS (DUF1049 family)
MSAEFLTGVLVGIPIGMGVIGIFWIRSQRRVTKKLKELEQKVRDAKIQTWLAWQHNIEFGDA